METRCLTAPHRANSPRDNRQKALGRDPMVTCCWPPLRRFDRGCRAEQSTEDTLVATKNGEISLLYSTHDHDHNSALVLKPYFQEK
jgi:hypothetical protein